jgi:hypothetical protein
VPPEKVSRVELGVNYSRNILTSFTRLGIREEITLTSKEGGLFLMYFERKISS